MSDIYRGRFVDLEKTPEANLRIVRTVGRRLFRDIQNVRKWLGIDAALRVLLDDHLASGWDEIRPEEIGALTSALLISDEAERNNDGDLTNVGRVYWNPRYQVDDEIEDLRRRGDVLFRGVQ
jgi:hypothetical protein